MDIFRKKNLNPKEENTLTYKGKIDSLQYLRAIAAIWVLITHRFQRLLLAPFGYTFAGQWGVDIFFILSGFIIYYTTKENAEWKKFAVKRFFRIFPLYWFCLLIYSLYKQPDFSLSTFVQNVLMIPFGDSIGYKSLVVGQAWSTCYELYFYFMLTLVLGFGLKKRNILFILIFLFCLSNVSRKFGIIPDVGFARYITSVTGNVGILFFLIGILICSYANEILSIRLSSNCGGGNSTGYSNLFIDGI